MRGRGGSPQQAGSSRGGFGDSRWAGHVTHPAISHVLPFQRPPCHWSADVTGEMSPWKYSVLGISYPVVMMCRSLYSSYFKLLSPFRANSQLSITREGQWQERTDWQAIKNSVHLALKWSAQWEQEKDTLWIIKLPKFLIALLNCYKNNMFECWLLTQIVKKQQSSRPTVWPHIPWERPLLIIAGISSSSYFYLRFS